jgi:two-component system LytT family response regulator
MSTMRIVFCDDDTAVMDKLKKYLRAYFSENKLKQPEYEAFTSGEELLKSDKRIDIAFLDVEMPGLDGITVGAKLKARFPYVKIIILTSFLDYLDGAMRFHVFRYLSKPPEKSRLYRNMKEALYQISIDTKPVLIETANESVTRFADEVIMVEADKHKVKVFAVDKIHAPTRDSLSP